MADARGGLQAYRAELNNLRGTFENIFAAANCDRVEIDNVTVTHQVAVGSFAEVYKGVMPNGKICAIKVQNKRKVGPRYVEGIVNEKKMLCAMDSVFIPKVYGAYQDRINVYLYMEFGDFGDLLSLTEDCAISEDLSRPYLAQVVCALEYMHACNIIYRDLKPDNCLVFEGGRLKIGDFGMSVVSSEAVTGYAGCPIMHAPEMIKLLPYQESVDFWALGVLFHVLLLNEAPYGVEEIFKAKGGVAGIGKALEEAELTTLSEANLTAAAKDIISNLLVKEPTERLGSRRGGVDEVKAHQWFSTVNFHDLIFEQEAIPNFNVPPFDGAPDDGAGLKNLGEPADEDPCWKTY